ncbi:MAG: hypothetical protein ACQEQC_06640 [Elusimicrobiota bacterium]
MKRIKIFRHPWILGIAVAGLIIASFNLIFLPLPLILLIVLFFKRLSGKNPLPEYSSPVEENNNKDKWPAVYESYLDLSDVQLLAARLKSENIPVYIENRNLFNSGIQWRLGLSVPLTIRVPPDHENDARQVIDWEETEKNNSPINEQD